MKRTSNGWVVCNLNHPANGEKMICEDTFSRTRKEAISKFINGTNSSWKFWYRKYNFRCKRCAVEITIN